MFKFTTINILFSGSIAKTSALRADDTGNKSASADSSSHARNGTSFPSTRSENVFGIASLKTSTVVVALADDLVKLLISSIKFGIASIGLFDFKVYFAFTETIAPKVIGWFSHTSRSAAFFATFLTSSSPLGE